MKKRSNGAMELASLLNLEEDEKINDSLRTANHLMQEQAKWDSSIKSFAANQLIDLAKDSRQTND
ncbi:hypothetical protein BSAF29S_02504 [Bacillus safensis subsp. safensis]